MPAHGADDPMITQLGFTCGSQTADPVFVDPGLGAELTRTMGLVAALLLLMFFLCASLILMCVNSVVKPESCCPDLHYTTYQSKSCQSCWCGDVAPSQSLPARSRFAPLKPDLRYLCPQSRPVAFRADNSPAPALAFLLLRELRPSAALHFRRGGVYHSETGECCSG